MDHRTDSCVHYKHISQGPRKENICSRYTQSLTVDNTHGLYVSCFYTQHVFQVISSRLLEENVFDECSTSQQAYSFPKNGGYSPQQN